MKKLIALFVSILLVMSMPITAFAQGADKDTASNGSNSVVTYFDDGSYLVETFSFAPDSYGAKSLKTDSKSTTFYESNNVAQWKVTLTGIFYYDGSVSSCTNASYSVDIYVSSWYEHSGNAYMSGNKAIANVTMKKKLAGIVVSTKNAHLEIACDATGHLS